jgi:lipoate-protein ligase A
MNVIVQHGCQKIVSSSNRVYVTGKMQINIFHGDHLGITPARCSSFNTKTRPQGRFPQSYDGFLANPVEKLKDKQVKSFKERVTCLREVLGYLPPMETIKQAMAEGFAQVLGVQLEPGKLTKEEEQMLAKELPRFQSAEWIYGTRTLIRDNCLSTAEHKTPGGLIRVSLRLDRPRNIIKSAFITGDFFAYPERSILDLEALLKNSSSRPSDVLKTVQEFFASHEVRIPGVEPDDFYHALYLAINRTGDENEQAVL